LAQQLFPGGIVIAPGIINPSEVVAATQKAIQSRQPLYEAAFSYHGGYERRRVRRDLEQYCALDTLGMVQIVERLRCLAA
jgi:hypothetical protein